MQETTYSHRSQAEANTNLEDALNEVASQHRRLRHLVVMPNGDRREPTSRNRRPSPKTFAVISLFLPMEIL